MAQINPQAPFEIEQVIAKALTKDASMRYQTAADLAADLRRLRKHGETSPAAPSMASVAAATPAQRSTDVSTSPPPVAAPAAEVTDISGSSSTDRGHRSRPAPEHWKGLVAAVVALALIGMGVMWWMSRGPKLTEEDYIVLTDFVNTTGENVFDGTLTKAVAVKLDESPYLNAYPEEKVRETLGFMEIDEDARITKDVAREICQRRGIRALMTGEIGSLGSQYVINVDAIDCQTGDTLARQQVEASGQDQVLAALGNAMTRMRRDLGESLASIERYDEPLEQATTKSLEAMKAFTVAIATRANEGDAAAIPHFQRALELDPNFAMAHGYLGTAMANIGGRQTEANEHRARAFELRDRVSEPERLYITAHYYDDILEDVDKTIETYEMWARTYPRDWTPHNNLAVLYNGMGEYEKQLEAGKRATELNPNHVFPRGNMAGAFRNLGRVEEALAVTEQAVADGLDTHQFHWLLFTVGHLSGDEELMATQGEWHRGKPSEGVYHLQQAGVAAQKGKRRLAHEALDRTVSVAETFNMSGFIFGNPRARAWLEYDFGDLDRAKQYAAEISIGDGMPAGAMADSAALFARLGDTERAAEIIERVEELHPSSTWVHSWDAPLARGHLALAKGDPEAAIEELRKARFERAEIDLAWVRGEAFLAAGRAAEALGEYQKILEWRGVNPLDGRRSLTHLQIARAHVEAGDLDAARDAYLTFLELWAEADEDIPILQKARAEYEALPGVKG